MFTRNKIPVSPENVAKLLMLCAKLKNHSFETPWSPFFNSTATAECDMVRDICYDDQDGIMEISVEDDDDNKKKNKDGGEKQISDMKDETKVSTSTSVKFKDNVTEKGQNEEIGPCIDENKVFKLKEVLISIQEGHPMEQCLPELDILRSTPLCLIPTLCQMLDLSALNEVAVAAVLNSLSHMDPPVSLNIAKALVHHAVYPKVMLFKGNSCRTLTAAILTFCDKHSTAIIEELFLPCLKNGSLDIAQIDILLKIIKANLLEEQICLCLRKAFETVEPVESSFPILQCLVEKKAYYEDTFYSLLVSKIKTWACSYNSNLKFTKLLISIISTYGNKVNDQQLSELRVIVQNNTTLLKKPAENLLNKIKK